MERGSERAPHAVSPPHRIDARLASLRRSSVTAVPLCVFLFGCGEDRPAAGPVTVNGKLATLIMGTPCEWNGDSACNVRSLTRRNPKLCLSQSDSARVIAGDGVHEIRAAAVRSPQRSGPIGLHATRDGSGWTIDLRRLPATTRALEITVAYDGSVLTPYEPLSENLEGADPQPIDAAVYAVRLRRAPCG